MRCVNCSELQGMAVDWREKLIQSKRSVQTDASSVSQLPVSNGAPLFAGRVARIVNVTKYRTDHQARQLRMAFGVLPTRSRETVGECGWWTKLELGFVVVESPATNGARCHAASSGKGKRGIKMTSHVMTIRQRRGEREKRRKMNSHSFVAAR